MRPSRLLPLRAAIRPSPTFRTRPRFTVLQNYSRHSFGQPTHETHPHILASGELTPGITALEYHERRRSLARKLPRDSIAILAASEVKYRSGPVFYEFHQEPNFFFLTGFDEPEAVCVIKKESDGRFSFNLFVRDKDEEAEKWEGVRSGVEAAKEVFNADESWDVDSVGNILPGMIRDANEVYTDVGVFGKKTAISRFMGGSSPKLDNFSKLLQSSTVKKLRPLMNELRLIKSEAELNNMRRAGQISGAVITESMRQTYKTERELWNDIQYGFKSQGLSNEAYIPVVGGGANGLSIHYTRNDARLNPGEMVLVDAGGEYGNYVTDITRTWPIDGRFTDPQKDLYNVVLAAQKSCLSMCREDANTSLDKLHRIAESQLKNGLKDIGFDTSQSGAMDVLFPHHVGHSIGLDVHDAPGVPRTETLKENMCITIEPAVYVPEDDERWPEHFRGMGIRIEDSVRVGAEKVEVLTSTAVKEVDHIEILRA